jgi:hypothetical protein
MLRVKRAQIKNPWRCEMAGSKNSQSGKRGGSQMEASGSKRSASSRSGSGRSGGQGSASQSASSRSGSSGRKNGSSSDR